MNKELLLDKILQIKIPPQFVITDGHQHYIENLTFNDIFKYIKSKHWHIENNSTTPHTESLYDHLITAANLSYDKATELGYNDSDKLKSYLSGLFHDIGKPGTQVIGKYNISFKGHAIVGSAMLDNFWSDNIEIELSLTKKDWGDICTCTCLHMCGYFPKQTSVNHMFNFQILPDSVKKLLVPLRYGDQLSIVHYNKVTEEINSTEKEFIDNYLSEPNIEEYITITRKNKGIIIQLLGTSFSGKKTFAKKLIEIFGSDKIIYIYSNQNNIIADCLNAINTGKIVIINILISQYLDIVKQLPEIIKNSYKINFWCFRNKLMYCDDILDINLQEQIKLYGNCNIYNPFQNDLDWKKLISCS